jgi:hypothetical protein
LCLLDPAGVENAIESKGKRMACMAFVCTCCVVFLAISCVLLSLDGSVLSYRFDFL